MERGGFLELTFEMEVPEGAVDKGALALCVYLRTILCALVVAAGISAQELAWWVTARFTPSQTAYENLRTADINPNWDKMLVLDDVRVPPHAKPDFPSMSRDGFAFQVDNFFKRPGISDREITGVYQDKSGHHGRFLLVLERAGTGPWKVAFLLPVEGDAGFSVFYRNGETLSWSFCMYCDGGSRLTFRGGQYRLETGPAH